VRHFGNNRNPGLTYPRAEDRLEKIGWDDRLEGGARKLGAPKVAYGTCSYLQRGSDIATGRAASSSPDTVSASTTDLKNV
jgi:hypothetical protein